MRVRVNTKRECEWGRGAPGVHGCEAPVSWICLPLWMEVSGRMYGMGRVGEEEKRRKKRKKRKHLSRGEATKKGPAKPG